LIASADLSEIGPPEMRLASILPNQAATVAPVQHCFVGGDCACGQVTAHLGAHGWDALTVTARTVQSVKIAIDEAAKRSAGGEETPGLSSTPRGAAARGLA